MTDPSADGFEALRLPVQPTAPRSAFALDLRARLHRRLGLDAPPGVAPMPKAAGLEYEIGGNPDGEAVLLMHAGTATAFAPLMVEPDLADRYRLVRYHRRGFAGSDAFDGEASIASHAGGALALLEHLGIECAHVVGHSGSGVMALQLALDAPSAVRSLVLEEPAIHAIDPLWDAIMLRAITPLIELYRAGDARGAMEQWMRGISRDWRVDLARTVPGGPQQTLDDAAAFFEDVEAVLAWPFDHTRVGTLALPVLYVVGTGSNPLTHAVMGRFQTLVPQAETAVIPGASHMLHTDQPQLVAAELSAFFDRHTNRA